MTFVWRWTIQSAAKSKKHQGKSVYPMMQDKSGFIFLHFSISTFKYLRLASNAAKTVDSTNDAKHLFVRGIEDGPSLVTMFRLLWSTQHPSVLSLTEKNTMVQKLWIVLIWFVTVRYCFRRAFCLFQPFQNSIFFGPGRYSVKYVGVVFCCGSSMRVCHIDTPKTTVRHEMDFWDYVGNWFLKVLVLCGYCSFYGPSYHELRDYIVTHTYLFS